MHDIRPFIPQLFTNPGSLLYIGARADAHSWLEELVEAGNQVVILEVWKENFDGLIDMLHGQYGISVPMWVVQGDVREVDEKSPEGHSFDYIFYWHGPEHLAESEIVPTLAKLESKCNRLITLACPYGLYPQEAHAGNPYEEHKTTLYPDFFTKLGYEVRADGKADKAGSEIVAWKVIG